MAKIKLLEKIEAAKTVTLTFTEFLTQKTSDGTDNVVVLILAEPIEYVRGSQNVPLMDGTTERMVAANVTEVSVLESDIDENFDWDEEMGIGTYKGKDMVLDVAKRNGGVWLRDTPFNVSAGQFRTKARSERFGSLIEAAKKDLATRKGTKEIVDEKKVGA